MATNKHFENIPEIFSPATKDWATLANLIDQDPLAPQSRCLKVGDYVLSIGAKYGAYCKLENETHPISRKHQHTHQHVPLRDYSEVEVAIFRYSDSSWVIPAHLGPIAKKVIAPHFEHEGTTSYSVAAYVNVDRLIDWINILLND